MPILIATAKGDRENLKGLLRAVVDVVEWRQSPDDPKRGDALVRLFELPPDLWQPQTPKTTRPDEPLISSSGRKNGSPTRTRTWDMVINSHLFVFPSSEVAEGNWLSVAVGGRTQFQ